MIEDSIVALVSRGPFLVLNRSEGTYNGLGHFL